MTKLSIIIPCFNCEDTLEEAVDSIYCQPPKIAFDVTMVDDASHDNTFKVMQKLSRKYPAIQLFRHKRNMGGGATRNTAVENSDGEIIFCLDSDDVLGKSFLENITDFWLEKRCDGVGKSNTIMFEGQDRKKIFREINYEIGDAPIGLDSFFTGDQSCSLKVTFLFTREAFNRIGGYPTDHGFDTQGFGFRFLCSGLTAFNCPNTIYYHRVKFNQSYYLRETNAGLYNKNFLQIFDEFLFIFKDETKDVILSYPLFPSEENGKKENIFTSLVKQKENIFSDRCEELIRLGKRGVADLYKESENCFDHYWLGNYYSEENLLRESINEYLTSMEMGCDYKMVVIKILAQINKIHGQDADVTLMMRDLLNYYANPIDSNSLSIKEAANIIRKGIWERIKRIFFISKIFQYHKKLKDKLGQ